MNYSIVYDVARTPFRWFTVIPIIAVILFGFILVLFPKLITKLSNQKSAAAVKIFGVVAIILGLFLFIGEFGEIRKQWRYRYLAVTGNCRIVEGIVNNFIPMPIGGHSLEQFTVNNIRFGYSDFIITGGFNNTSSYGGPIKEGLQVRICYIIDEDNSDQPVIIRLETSDLSDIISKP